MNQNEICPKMLMRVKAKNKLKHENPEATALSGRKTKSTSGTCDLARNPDQPFVENADCWNAEYDLGIFRINPKPYSARISCPRSSIRKTATWEKSARSPKN